MSFVDRFLKFRQGKFNFDQSSRIRKYCYRDKTKSGLMSSFSQPSCLLFGDQ